MSFDPFDEQLYTQKLKEEVEYTGGDYADDVYEQRPQPSLKNALLAFKKDIEKARGGVRAQLEYLPIQQVYKDMIQDKVDYLEEKYNEILSKFPIE